MLSQAAVLYEEISTLAWGRSGRIIEYGYDANGSLTSKMTRQGGQITGTVVYEYNLQNRLCKAMTTTYSQGQPVDTETVEYRYDPAGIRTEKVIDNAIRIEYLVDPENPTGYVQVLEESQFDLTSPASPVLESVVYYTLGDDVISQTRCYDSGSGWQRGDTQYLLYDGHGSTRQLVDGSLTVIDAYNYDGYGVMLGSNDSAAANAKTSMLYTGEQYDKSIGQYYLRARYYNQSNGTFNRIDPYSGNPQDPQSLHKYAYCHNNPTNAVDPSGLMWSIPQILTVTGIIVTLIATLYPIGGGVISAHRAGVSLSDYWGELRKWETWAEALIALGFGCLTTYAVRQIAICLGMKAFMMFGFIMSILSLFNSIRMTHEMFGETTDGLKDEIAHFLAVMTATIVIIIGIGFAFYRHENYYSDSKRAMARGRQREAQVLKEMGLDKNRTKIRTCEGSSIPDGLTDTTLIEIKDRKDVYFTRQLRIETQGAGDRETMLVTGVFSRIHGGANSAFTNIFQHPDLGPGTGVIYLQMIKSLALNKIFIDFGDE
jgi:RHS repeat-associated protein